MFNLVNGGKHATNNLDFQEYMIIPIGMPTFHDKLAAGRKIFYALGNILHEADSETQIGFEGGYAPNLNTNEEGLGFLVQAIKAAGYIPGSDVVLGVDIAASALPSTYSATVENYISLFENFPMYSIEDPFGEDDWDNWVELKSRLDKMSDGSNTRLLVGDDLFVGSQERIDKGMKLGAANSVLVKINQSGTLTELLNCINLARQLGCIPILSHRSGETLDSFVSDLAVGTAAPFIKAGSPNDQAPERIVKYERIVEIEEELHVANTR
jgi:enolase